MVCNGVFPATLISVGECVLDKKLNVTNTHIQGKERYNLWVFDVTKAIHGYFCKPKFKAMTVEIKKFLD